MIYFLNKETETSFRTCTYMLLNLTVQVYQFQVVPLALHRLSTMTFLAYVIFSNKPSSWNVLKLLKDMDFTLFKKKINVEETVF